jgi:predicted enzyme related to lactoylglutathione lyase
VISCIADEQLGHCKINISLYTLSSRYILYKGSIVPSLGVPSRLGQSKQCLADHGINATIFAYPFDIGWNDPTIVNIVSKYYDLARTGNDPLTFLHCDGYKNHPQTDCRTYTDNGELTFANRYSVRSWGHDTVEIKDGFNDDETYNTFIEEVNSQNAYNGGSTGGYKINAIPLITYHNVDYLTGSYHTDAATGQPMEYWLITTTDDKGNKALGGGMMKRQMPEHKVTRLVFIKSIDEYKSKVEKLGGKVLAPKHTVPGMGYFALCLDTENNPFAIWESNESAK